MKSVDKSYVGMAYYICPFCGEKVDEHILLDTRLENSLEKDNILDVKLCEKCKEEYPDYICMVEMAKANGRESIGRSVMIRKKAAAEMLRKDIDKLHELYKCDTETMNWLYGQANMLHEN